MEFISGGGGEPPTKQFWIPVTYGDVMTNLLQYPVARCTDAFLSGFMSFMIPHDFNSIIEAYIVVVPTSTQAAADWNISTRYGAIGEVYNIHFEYDNTSTYNVSADIKFGVDISGILTNIAPGDYLGVMLTQGNAAHNVDVLGIMFKYD